MNQLGRITAAGAVWLLIPVWLAAAGFSILERPTKEIRVLDLYSRENVTYLDLKELEVTLGDSLYWERPAEGLVWLLEGGAFKFEDLLTFFTFNGESYQLVAPCLLDGGRFLVPLQLVIEYLPRFFPGRFVYNKLDGRLIDRTGRTLAAGKRGKKLSAPSNRDIATDGKSFRIQTVVIDPGHGGKDPGALGRRYKLKEKYVVLDICKKVAAKLRKSGDFKVILTRDRDRFVPLAARGKLANRQGAGLFISIHCNSHRKSTVRGASTYFLDAAKTDEERATAMLENAALQYEIEDANQERRQEISLILQDMAQNEFLRESKELCSYIQQEMVKLKALPDKGIRQANFAVLRGAYMPAALVETAYISNAKDEALLRSRKFRERLADAIARGIINYINYYHKKLASG